MSGGMVPKNKNIQNPQWDRWGQKENVQGSQSWNRNRNLSWRLKPQLGKSDQYEGLMSSSSGDGIQLGNPIIPPSTLKKENESVRPAFCQKCGVEGHCWGLVLKCYESRTRQHRMLNIKALRHSKHYFPWDIMIFRRRL
jgi:hypothetical protein